MVTIDQIFRLVRLLAAAEYDNGIADNTPDRSDKYYEGYAEKAKKARDELEKAIVELYDSIN